MFQVSEVKEVEFKTEDVHPNSSKTVPTPLISQKKNDKNVRILPFGKRALVSYE